MSILPTNLLLREKLAQLLFVRIGSNLSPMRTVEEDESRIGDLLATCPIGGLIVFNGHYAETPQTLARLQAASRYPLLIAADLERGLGQQLQGYPLFPHARAFGELGVDARAAVRQFAALTGAAARAAGVHIAFAPVADVDSDPRNPIISTRAFAAEPERVAELVAAFVAGARESGLLVAAKHFPGHGDTYEDSHHMLPAVDQSRTMLLGREIVPFSAAIAAGAAMVMTAHVRYPALDPSGVAATLSRPILTELLREELGFQGVVVSDSLLMEGVKIGHATEGDLAIAALNAGVDVLLDVATPEATLDALEVAVASRRLALARVEEAIGRVKRLKQAAFEGDAHFPFDESKNRSETGTLANEVASKAIRVIEAARPLLPLAIDRPLCAIFANPFHQPNPAQPQPLGQALSRRFQRLDYHELGAEPTCEQLLRISLAAERAEQLLVAFVVKPAAWHRFGLAENLRKPLADVINHRPTVVACLGSPRGLEAFAGAAVRICAFSDVPASQVALADGLTE